MSFAPSTFRQQFPEFHDPKLYSDIVIGLWSGAAGSLMDPTRWGANLDLGTSLFVAHHLAMAARDKAAADAGGVPGQAQGVLTAKAVDKVSASYDAGSISLTDQGFWGMTSYGIRFLTLARMMGAGGIQIC